MISKYNPKAKKDTLKAGGQPLPRTQVKEKVSLADVMEDNEDKADKKKPAPVQPNMDLQDIGKKLDEILDSDIVAGV